MATLLDEILQETNITGAEARGSSKTHSAGCKCFECGMKKIQPTGKHKSWRERRDERLTKKDGQKRPVQNNRSSAINSEFGWGRIANPFTNLAAAAPYSDRRITAGAAGAVSGTVTGTCQIPVQIPSNIGTALSVRMSKKDKSGKRHVLGYAGSGGGRLSNILSAINRCGKLNISPDEIDMFQRISNVETGGLIQAINSWDSAYMSMGFMQLTAKYGELQRLIQRAPASFNRYGIALDSQKYSFGEFKIRGTTYANELRNRDWAERFFRAGLDVDIIIAEVIHGRAIIQSLQASIRNWLGTNFQYFNNFYNSSSILRALVQETHNNRPAYLRSALQSAVREAKARIISQILPFLTLLRDKIRGSYKANAARENDTPQHMLLKAEHIISRTAVL